MTTQSYILKNAQAIVRDSLDFGAASAIVDNAWSHLLLPVPDKKDSPVVAELADLPEGDVSVPLALWLKNKAVLEQRSSKVAVQIGAADFVESLVDDLVNIETIILPFDHYVDGRSYSHAYLLRTRYGFQGEIRAVGSVHHDHLNFLARVGVNAFELPEGHDLVAAQQAFNSFSEVYQPSADNGRLIYSRRRAIH